MSRLDPKSSCPRSRHLRQRPRTNPTVANHLHLNVDVLCCVEVLDDWLVVDWVDDEVHSNQLAARSRMRRQTD